MTRALILLLLLLLWPHPLADLPGPGKMSVAQTFLATVTAYTSSDRDCGKHDGITATGSLAGPGTVASDWNTLPPGTRLEIPGYGPAVVADRGEAIQGDKLDVWVRDEMTARKFGRQRLKVRILP
jgi:3D (Asp-Asp-Asp) domain-containing protein